MRKAFADDFVASYRALSTLPSTNFSSFGVSDTFIVDLRMVQPTKNDTLWQSVYWRNLCGEAVMCAGRPSQTSMMRFVAGLKSAVATGRPCTS
jgi:hypothetical protein